MVPESEIETEESPGANYVSEWRRFALRYHLALFLLYSWVPLCGGLFLLSRFWIHQPVSSLLLMGVWLLAAVGAVWWAGEFRCPRCRRRYAALGRGHSVSLTRGLFDKICSNCKLTKFEN